MFSCQVFENLIYDVLSSFSFTNSTHLYTLDFKNQDSEVCENNIFYCFGALIVLDKLHIPNLSIPVCSLNKSAT